LAADVGWAWKLLLPKLHPVPLAAVVLGSYGVVYFAVTFVLDITEARPVVGKALRLLRLAK
jgi:hypothetical protein